MGILRNRAIANSRYTAAEGAELFTFGSHAALVEVPDAESAVELSERVLEELAKIDASVSEREPPPTDDRAPVAIVEQNIRLASGLVKTLRQRASRIDESDVKTIVAAMADNALSVIAIVERTP